MNNFDYKEWVKRRRRTTIIFNFETCALGIEYSLTFTTLYVYLTDVLKAKHVVAYYSIISAAFLVSQITMSLIMCRLFDRYRNLRTMIFMGNSMVIIGNILYTIPLSPWLLFMGRLISGGGGSLRAIMTSELTRSYPVDELLKKYTTMSMAFGLGFLVGPAIGFAFVKADFWFLGIHIVYANGAGLVVTFIFMALQIAAICFVSDLSREFDLKEERNESNADEIQEEKEEDSQIMIEKIKSLLNKEPQSAISIFVELLCNTDTLIILIFSFYFFHCIMIHDMWLPMVCVELLHWGVFEINTITFVSGIAAFCIFMPLVWKSPKPKMLIYMAMICVICLACIQGMFLTFKLYNSNRSLNIALWAGFVVWTCILCLIEDVFLISTMAQMVPSNIQAFTESIRLSTSRAGAVIGLLTAAPAFGYLQYVCVGYLVVTVLMMIGLVLKRKPLQYPQITIRKVY